MIINLDSDDVIYDCIELFKRRMEQVFDRKLPPPTSWRVGESWDISNEDIDYHFVKEARDGLFQLSEPVPGAIAGVYALLEAGHDIRVVTNKGVLGWGSLPAIRDTVGWYAKWGLIGDVDLVFTRGYEKQGYPADVVVDDRPDLSWTQEGAANILFDRPWNGKIVGATNNSWIRAMDWDNIIELVEIETEDR